MMIPAPLKVVRLMYIVTIWISAVRSDVMFETVRKQNIPIEKHTVITPDGYILGLYRIPARINQASNDTKVILMMPSLPSSSVQYVLYPKDSAAFYFHDYGYDVWLGNGRGNTYSRNHTDLDPDESEFWKFSFHEIGTIDMPALIDYILKYTNKGKVILYGQSQGSTTALAMLADRPEYNNRISSMHLLSAAVIHNETHLPMQWFIKNVKLIAELAEENDLSEVLANDDFAQKMKLLGKVCAAPIWNYICKRIFEQLAGPFSQNSFSKSLVSDLAKVGIPAGGSVRQFIHYLQCFSYGGFVKYDHGATENLKLYGSKQPPEYNLSNVQTNVQIMYGTQDYMASESNTNYLTGKLRNAKQICKDKMESFNHLNFIIPPHLKSVNKLVYKAIKQFER